MCSRRRDAKARPLQTGVGTETSEVNDREERTLWRHLWRIPLEGTHFRRQASLGVYFPDFISHRLKLIVEVDGAQHGFEAQSRHDEKRTAWFESQGYRVIRFWNHEIKSELDSVLDTIYAAVEERRVHLAASHPTPALRADPPHRGEGEEP